MLTVAVTGARGMLGRALCAHLTDCKVIALGHAEMDVTDDVSVEETIARLHPDVLIHCAAMTAVDRCETEVDTAYRLNAVASANVAAACQRHGVRLIAISTDYVFEGDADRPYHEFDTATGGHCVYGQSKWAAEESVRTHCPNHIIARVSWLYGAGGPSFVHTMMRLADGTRPELRVVDDQRGNPTSCMAVTRAIDAIIRRPALVGTFHLTCEGEASWCEFAKEIFRLADRAQAVSPCTSAQYPTPAKRPANSRLEKRMLRLTGLPAMPQWQEALSEFMQSEFKH